MSKNTEEKRPKRDHGDGSITLRNDGKWTARIQIGTNANGKPKIKAFYGKTEAEVKRKLKDFKKNINNLPNKKVKDIALGTYILNWLYTYKKNNLKPLSLDRLESTIKNYIIPKIGYLKLTSINQDDIQDLFNEMYSKELSYSSIKKVRDALNSCFKHALIKDELIKNPVLGTSIPSYNQFMKKEIIYFNKEQITKIKEELFRKYKTGKSVYSHTDAYIVILNTGTRIGEALGLKWEDIDFQKKTMFIKRNIIMTKKRNANGEIEEKGYNLKVQDTTKTYSGQRIIHLNSSAIQSLQNIKNKNIKNSEYVMINSKGKIIPPHNFDRTFYKVLKNIGIPQCGVHSLRHTFASMLFQKGVDVKTVSELLGHSDVSVTYNTYIHLIKEQKINAINLIDDI